MSKISEELEDLESFLNRAVCLREEDYEFNSCFLQLKHILKKNKIDLKTIFGQHRQNYISLCLIGAIRKSNFTMVKLLLEHGADPNQPLTFKAFPKDHVTDINDPFKALMDMNISPLHTAIESCNPKMLDLLVKAGANYYQASLIDPATLPDPTLILEQLYLAITTINPGIAEMRMKADAGSHGSEREHLEYAKFLIHSLDAENGSSFNEVALLYLRTFFKIHNIVSLQQIFDTTVVTSLLLNAITKSHFSMTKLLLEYGADPKAIWTSQDGTITTPLHMALESGNPQMVNLLLKAGADLKETHRSPDGTITTPLHMAIESGNPEIVELLVKAGADLKETHRSQDGAITTPLHMALESGNPQMVHLLVKAGADLKETHRSPDGTITTPLHMAIESGNPEIVELLVKAGADLNEIYTSKEIRIATYKKLADIGYEPGKAAYVDFLLFSSISLSSYSKTIKPLSHYKEAIKYLSPDSKDGILVGFLIDKDLLSYNYSTIISWLNSLTKTKEYSKTEYNEIISGQHSLYKIAIIAQELKGTKVINKIQEDNITKILALHEIGKQISSLKTQLERFNNKSQDKSKLRTEEKEIEGKIDLLAKELANNPYQNLNNDAKEFLTFATKINKKLAQKGIPGPNLVTLSNYLSSSIDSPDALAHNPAKAAGSPESALVESSRKFYTIHEGLLREYADANTKTKGLIAADIGLEVGSNTRLVEKFKAYKDRHTSTEGGLIAEILYALNKKALPKVTISFLEKLDSTQAKMILSELNVDDDTATIATVLTFDGAATANLSVSAEDLGDSPWDIAVIDDAVEDYFSESSDSEDAAAAAAPSLTKKEKSIFQKIISRNQDLKLSEVKKLIDKLQSMGEPLEYKHNDTGGCIIIDKRACEKHAKSGNKGLSGAANMHLQHGGDRTTDELHPAFLNDLSQLLQHYATDYIPETQDFELGLCGAAMTDMDVYDTP